MKMHPTVTLDRVAAAAVRQMTTFDEPGFCTACGAEADGVEPDARRYECESCGTHAVYGAEELFTRLVQHGVGSGRSVLHPVQDGVMINRGDPERADSYLSDYGQL